MTRAAALMDAIKQVTYIGGRAGLATLEATRREPLPDLDRVLPELIEILREAPAGFGFGAEARELLGEATEWHRGIDGLADLARTPGPEQAAAYRDWVDALIRGGPIPPVPGCSSSSTSQPRWSGGPNSLPRRPSGPLASRWLDVRPSQQPYYCWLDETRTLSGCSTRGRWIRTVIPPWLSSPSC